MILHEQQELKKCEQCKAKMTEAEEWILFNKVSKRFMSLCSKCGTKFYLKSIKDMKISKAEQAKHDADVNEIKSDLEKWTKDNMS